MSPEETFYWMVYDFLYSHFSDHEIKTISSIIVYEVLEKEARDFDIIRNMSDRQLEPLFIFGGFNVERTTKIIQVLKANTVYLPFRKFVVLALGRRVNIQGLPGHSLMNLLLRATRGNINYLDFVKEDCVELSIIPSACRVGVVSLLSMFCQQCDYDAEEQHECLDDYRYRLCT
jgi:hypothetical protein